MCGQNNGMEVCPPKMTIREMRQLWPEFAKLAGVIGLGLVFIWSFIRTLTWILEYLAEVATLNGIKLP